MDNAPTGGDELAPREGSQAQREMAKCEECRRKKVKCLPVSRNWSNLERCAKCELKDLPCGPNLLAPRSLKRRQSTATSTTTTTSFTLSDTIDTTSPLSPTQVPIDPANLIPRTPQRPAPPPWTPSISSSGGTTRTSSAFANIHDSSYLSSPSPSLLSSTTCASPSEQEAAMAAKFNELGINQLALETLQHRHQSIDRPILGSNQTRAVAEVEDSLILISSGLYQKQQQALELLIERIECTDTINRRCNLRRALDFIDSFERWFKVSNQGDELPGKISQLKCATLERLFVLYRNREVYEAEKYLLRLAALPKSTLGDKNDVVTLQLADSLVQSSLRMSEVVREVHIHPNYRRKLHITGKHIFPPIQRAMHARNNAVTRHLSSRTKNFLAERDIIKCNTIHVAAESEHLETMRFVNHMDCPWLDELLGQRDAISKDPLLVAAQTGNYQIFEHLLKQHLSSSRLKLDNKDHHGHSAMSLASAGGHLEIVELLLHHGVSPNDNVICECTPLHAAARGGHLDVCQVLLSFNAWVDFEAGPFLQSPKEIAQQNGHALVVDLLEAYEGRLENMWPYGQDGVSNPMGNEIDTQHTFSSLPSP